MLDGVSLDQLRMFVAAHTEGSFSGAARRLRRSQPAVSETISGLEMQLGLALFDRRGRYPRLTPAGQTLLADAQAVLAGVDGLKARAKGMAGGLEAELTAVIDVFYPIEAIAHAAHEFRRDFPQTPLHLRVEALGAALLPVLNAQASFGLVGSVPDVPEALVSERLTSVDFVMVAAATHPLSQQRGVLNQAVLARHIQLVLTDRSDLTLGRQFGVLSPHVWRLADLGAKHAFLLNGLGWGGMPRYRVQADLDAGRLVRLNIEDIPAGGLQLPMSAVYRADDPPGPAGRWMIEHLKQFGCDSVRPG